MEGVDPRLDALRAFRLRPKALDLFCGAGGVSVGLQRAGFDVTGVDINPQPNHKGGTFVQADALKYPLEGFDFIWASPPCQRYTVALEAHPGKRLEHPDHIPAVRRRLVESGGMWCIENVIGAPLRGIRLCGLMFGLKVYRHRIFECSHLVWEPPHPAHEHRCAAVGRPVESHGFMTVAGHFSDVAAARRAMDIDWMTRDELAQAIPPAYAEYIGRQVIAHIK